MARQDRITLKNVRSDSTKKISGDNRNNWIEMLFVTKKRFRCFRKQTHIDTCKKRLNELGSLGFEFGEFGFADIHVHFLVTIPKKYSVEETDNSWIYYVLIVAIAVVAIVVILTKMRIIYFK